MQRGLFFVGLFGLACITAAGQDPAKVAAGQCKVAFENEYVRVLHWTLGPHDKVPMHQHPALVTVSLSDGKTRYTSSDATTREIESKAGQATWSDPDRHASEYLGNNRSNVLQIELKKKPTPAMTALPSSEDSVKVDPKHYRVEFQNDHVRVLRIKYGPNEKSVMHAHPANVAVFLTDGSSKFTLPDGKTSLMDIKAGQVQWGEKEAHLPENTGTKSFELILIELR